MPEGKLLEFTLVAFTADQLEIKVKNISGAALDQTLVIEIRPPMYLVDSRIKQAAREASTNEQLHSMARLSGVVTAPPGWSVWAKRDPTDAIVLIQLYNDVDQTTANMISPPVKFEAGAEFTLRIPLDPQASHARVELAYSHEYITHEGQSGSRTDGSLELKPADAGDWTPRVSLTVTHPSPSMIEPGALVKVEWQIKDWVSATLRGPLPGGNSEVTLSTDPNAKDFRIAGDSLEIRAVGPMTYMLQAEVKRPGGQPNLLVLRVLSLDIASGKKYSYLLVQPTRVLPNGLMELHWAAWGVQTVQISVSGQTSRKFQLTQQNLSRFYQGNGVMRATARKIETETITLQGQLKNIKEKPRTVTVLVISWQKMVKPDFTGQPLGLAVAGPKLGLLTSDGLWIAEAGEVDPDSPLQKLIFNKVSGDTPKLWLGLTAVGKRFVALRQTSQDDLQVAAYSLKGQPDDVPPVDLPGDLRAGVTQGATYDLAAFGGRAYIVVESSAPGAASRRAFSVGFDGKLADLRPEPLLEFLTGYRLVPFDGALYALNRESGRVFRFVLTSAGQLDQPRPAASAVEGGKSMIQKGLLVPVGRVLAVLGPSGVPSLGKLQGIGLHNVLSYVTVKEPTTDPNSVPQDLVYNPQQDYWSRCGHDLEIKKGAVAAYRPGESPRLWVIQPDGETHTLAVGSEELFAHDYDDTFPSKVLQPFLNKKRQFTLVNGSGLHFFPISDSARVFQNSAAYRKAGISDLSSDVPIEMPLPPKQIMPPDGTTTTVEFKYHEADPAPITLRFLVKHDAAKRPRTGTPDYLLEVTFSGPDLSSASVVFKRISIDDLGQVSIDEMWGTRAEHSTANPIPLARPKQFDEIVKMVVVNASPRARLRQTGLDFSGPFITDMSELILKHTFTDFVIGIETRVEPRPTGELRVNLNFAKAPGIEASPGSQPQTRFIRINTDDAGSMQVRLVKVLNPGDPPLQLEAAKTPIVATDGPVYVCQIATIFK